MNFHILGLGPIGCLIAHNLRRYLPRETGVTLIVKNLEQASQRRSKIEVVCNGLVAKSHNFAVEVFDDMPPAQPHHTYSKKTNSASSSRSPSPNPNTPSPTGIHAHTTPISSLIVSAKAHQTVSALEQLRPRLDARSTVVLLQNGMGVFEEVLAHVFRNPSHRPHFILASNNHGAFAYQNRIVHSGVGSLDLAVVPDEHGRDFEAALQDPTNDSQRLRLDDITTPEDPEYERYKSLRSTLAALLSLQQLNVSWKSISALQLAMRQKVVVNSVINPLTAIMRCRNGDIFKHQAGLDINTRVCAEASRAFVAQIKAETADYLEEARRQGYTNVDPGRIPPALLETSLEQEVLRVAQITAGNKSSMLSDIEKGKQTEIDYINGYLLRVGAEYNVPMPTTEALYNLVKLRSTIPLDQML